MRYIYLICVFSLSVGFASAQSPDALTGYIVTKNNYHLTGAIGIIEHSEVGSMVEYINDFGTPYYLHPALIKGFVFYEGPAVHAYESKYYRDHWMYLRVQYAGKNINLLQTPEKIVKYEWQDGKVVSRSRKVVQYWVELPGDRIQPLRRWGFRSQMRRLMEEKAPRLARKIGKRGYRYPDLYKILEEYDQECAKGKRRL